jgi:SAM-dependent methyltransferase
LDLGCGPGFYTQRLAALGHTCVGVDFSPASILYAQEKAGENNFSEAQLRYVLEDIRNYQPEGEFDCVMMIFGEVNVFAESDARQIFAMAHKALKPGGLFVLEGHTYNAVVETGASPTLWWQAKKDEGLLADADHLCLQENFWDEIAKTATTRYYIIIGETGEVRQFCSSMTAYTDKDYAKILMETGFTHPTRLSTKKWPVGAPFVDQMMTLVMRK